MSPLIGWTRIANLTSGPAAALSPLIILAGLVTAATGFLVSAVLRTLG